MEEKVLGSRQEALQRIGKAMAAKGIPAWLLASNIKEPAYTEIHLVKTGDTVTATTVFTDEESGTIRCTYHYDVNSVLQRIDMEVADRTSVYYDRAQELTEMVADAGLSVSPAVLFQTAGANREAQP